MQLEQVKKHADTDPSHALEAEMTKTRQLEQYAGSTWPIKFLQDIPYSSPINTIIMSWIIIPYADETEFSKHCERDRVH